MMALSVDYDDLKRKFRCFSLLLLWVLVPGTYAAPSNSTSGQRNIYASIIDEFRDDLRQRVVAKEFAGITAALVDNGEIVWAQGFGRAQTGPADADMTADTPLRIGSLSKVVTALGVLQLEDRGKIDIDQPMYLYLPRFHMHSRFSDGMPPTVRQMLTHHAGIPTDLYKGQWTTARFTEVVDQLRTEYVTYPPDFIRSYSNVGYSLLGSMIEEVTERPLEQFLQESIFTPLGLRNTGFHPATLENSPGLGFSLDLEPQRLFPIRDLPAMGLYSSARDMARLLSFLLDRDNHASQSLLSKIYLEEMFEQQNGDINLDFDDKVGIPWLLDQCGITESGTIAEHGGSTMYFSSQAMLSIEYRLGVVVLANTAGSRKKVNALAEQLLASAIEVKHRISPMPVADHQGTHPEQETYSKVTSSGEYLTDIGLVKIDPIQKELCQCERRQVIGLLPLPNGWYQLGAQEARPGQPPTSALVSEVEIDQNPVVVLRDSSGRTHRVGSLLRQEPISDAWRERLGEYMVINPDDRFEFDQLALFEREDRLYLRYRMPDLDLSTIELPITAISDFEAVTSGLGRNRGETITIRRFSGDDMEYLIFSGYVAERSE